MSPFYKPLPKVPGFGVDVTAEEIGWGVVGAVAALTAAHAVGSAIRVNKEKEEVEKEEKPASS
jgi:hydrogenase small subunit